MSGNFVNFDGFGAASVNETQVDDLNKAITAGTGYAGAPGNLTGGGALQMESLDTSLKSVTFEMKNLRLWPILSKDQAYNTIEEYNRQDSFGDQSRGFVAESALPRSQDANWSRQLEQVRFIAVTREISDVMLMVRTAHGDAEAQQVRAGTMRILEIVERSLMDGRGHYSHNGVFDGAESAINAADLSWNGLSRQIRRGEADPTAKAKAFTGYGAEESVIGDMRGLVIDEEALEEAGRVVADNFGAPSLLLAGTKAVSDLSKQFYPKERINPMGVSNGRAGYVLTEFVSSAGAYAIQGSVFMKPKQRPTDPTHAIAPAQPTGVAAANGLSKFSANDAGDYLYLATAIVGGASDGEGPLSPVSAAVSVDAGEGVTLTIPAVAGAYAYAVYRSAKGGDAASAQFIGYVAPSTVGGAGTLIDLNHKLPGMGEAVLLSNESEVVRFKQLAPLYKADLAKTAMTKRWFQALLGMPIVYAPRKNYLFENIGKAA